MADAIHAEGNNVTFEFISPGSPQYNGVAARYATDMSNYLVTSKSPMSPYEKFMGHKFGKIDTLHSFGEMAIVEDHPSRGMHSKVQDRDKPALFIGTTHKHTRNMYCFLNLLTHHFIMSRDVIWLTQSYGEFHNISPPTMPAIWTHIFLAKDVDGPIEAREVPAPPGIPDAVEEEDFVETLFDEDEDDFVAEKKVLIRLKKFIPAVMPPPAFANKAVPIGIETERVPVTALVSILAPNPLIVDFGYDLQAVDTVVEPIKYKDMFDVPETELSLPLAT
jgi:hypothetical protein